MKSDYDHYWKSIHKDKGLSNLQIVCNPMLSPFANRTLNRIHTRSISKILQSLSLGKDARILEIGCGNGRWAASFASKSALYFGIDLSLDALKTAAGHGNGPLLCSDGSRLPIAPGTLDLVFHITVAQHLTYVAQAHLSDEVRRVLKPGGLWILAEMLTPDGKISSDVHWEGVFPRAAGEWQALVEKGDFQIEKKERFQYLPLFESFTQAVNGFESRRRSKRKRDATPENSDPGGPDSPAVMPARAESWKLRIYRRFRSILENVFLSADRPLDFLFGKSIGDHILIVSRKQ